MLVVRTTAVGRRLTVAPIPVDTITPADTTPVVTAAAEGTVVEAEGIE